MYEGPERRSGRDFGRLEAQVEALQNDMQEVKADVKKLLDTQSEQRGSWKTLATVGGVAGAVGSFVAKAFWK